jgi:hypothetical protein
MITTSTGSDGKKNSIGNKAVKKIVDAISGFSIVP